MPREFPSDLDLIRNLSSSTPNLDFTQAKLLKQNRFEADSRFSRINGIDGAMGKISIDLEIDTELFQWFEDYCEGGLLDLDEELSAVVGNFIQEQIEEVGVTVEVEPAFEGPEVLDEFEEGYEDDYFDREESG